VPTFPDKQIESSLSALGSHPSASNQNRGAKVLFLRVGMHPTLLRAEVEREIDLIEKSARILWASTNFPRACPPPASEPRVSSLRSRSAPLASV